VKCASIKESKYEQLVYSILSSLGCRFERQAEISGYEKLAGRKHRYDAIIRTRRLALEVDGCWYHGCKECFSEPKSWQLQARRRDTEIDQFTTLLGWRIARIKIHDLQVEPKQAVKRALKRSCR